jgi:hypothetical protein
MLPPWCKGLAGRQNTTMNSLCQIHYLKNTRRNSTFWRVHPCIFQVVASLPTKACQNTRFRNFDSQVSRIFGMIQMFWSDRFDAQMLCVPLSNLTVVTGQGMYMLMESALFNVRRHYEIAYV